MSRLYLLAKTNWISPLINVTGIPCRFVASGPTRLWRSFFYVPGDKPEKIRKVAALPEKYHNRSELAMHIPDLVVLDCEDAVALDQKQEARKTIADALRDHTLFAQLRTNLHRTLIVRINSLDSGLEVDDLEAVLDAAIESAKRNNGCWSGPDLFCLPKVEHEDHLAWLSDRILQKLSKVSGLSLPSLGLVAMIESCKAIVNLPRICEKSRDFKIPLSGIVFGSDDYCVTLGVDRSPNNVELLHARQFVPVVAKAFGLCSIDMVDIDFKDTEKLRANCEFGSQLGFDGKQTIHPNQLPVVNCSFSPSPERIEWYRAMLLEARKHSHGEKGAIGAGAFNFRGKMIDRPTLRQAEHAVALADLMEL